MYKELVGVPLQQVLVLLWFAGLCQLVWWVVEGNPAGSLAGPALLGTALSVLLAGRLRKPLFLPVAAGLGLAVVSAVADRWGILTPATLATLTALYGLLLWLFVLRTLQLPLTAKLIQLLALQGGYRAGGGRQTVESTIHWTSFALILLALYAVALLRAVATAALPTAPLPVLTISLVFLACAGWRYRLVLHSYLFIAIGAWGVLSLYAWLTGAGYLLNPADPWLGLLLALYALAAWVIGWQLGMRTPAAGESQPGFGLYVRPLHVSVVGLGCLATAQIAGLQLTGVLTNPGWIALACSGVAALALLLPSRVLEQSAPILLGALLATLSWLWLYSAGAHGTLPFGLWPGYPALTDLWLVLAVLALALAVTSHAMTPYPAWERIYTRPLWQGAVIVYGWVLLGALALFAGPWTPYLGGILAVLIAGLFPLSRPFETGAQVRGVGLALLLSLLAVSLLGPDPLRRMVPASVAWAYGLWLIGNLCLPRCNARCPAWAVAVDAWPWFGLLVLGGGFALLGPAVFIRWEYGLAAAGYLFLLLRNSAWPGFPWLAVLAMTWAGLLFSGERHLTGLIALESGALVALAVETLLWANLLLLGAVVWRRCGDTLAVRFGWQNPALEAPFLSSAFGLFCIWLLFLIGHDTAAIFTPTGELSAVLLGGLLAISLGHGLYWRRSPFVAHLFILAVFCTVLAIWGVAQPFHLPLLLALWGICLAVDTPLAQVGEGLRGLLGQAPMLWASFTPWVTLVALVALTGVPLPERLLTLAVLIGNALVLGWWRRQRHWLVTAAVMLIVLLHGLWLIWVPAGQARVLLPWTALQLALLCWALTAVSKRVQRPESPQEASPQEASPLILLAEVLIQLMPALAGLAVVEWVVHGLDFAYALAAGQSPLRFAGGWDNGAALVAACLLAALGMREARRRQSERWIYGVAVLLGLAGVYCRLWWVEFAPLSVWDTAAVMAAAYGLFILQRLTLSRPVLNLALALPLLALATVPFQLGSGHASLTLAAAAALYLMTRRATGMEMPLYLGLLALNGGIYLWIPGWAEHSGLFQVYLFPAVLTVLLLLHLHRRELKPSVLNSARLAAISALYAVAALDVFLRPDFAIFVLALALSVSGIVVGIGLRTRAFLYAGVIFLVLNVLGQLVKLYPEQRLGRALVLMALGAAITGAMIGFNMKREAILQRIRIFRADLEKWD